MEKNLVLMAVTTQLLQNTFKDVLSYICRHCDDIGDKYDLDSCNIDAEVATLRSMCQQCAKINPHIEETALFKAMNYFAYSLENENLEVEYVVKLLMKYFPDLLEELEKEEQENVT